jgi:hypothetical protein
MLDQAMISVQQRTTTKAAKAVKNHVAAAGGVAWTERTMLCMLEGWTVMVLPMALEPGMTHTDMASCSLGEYLLALVSFIVRTLRMTCPAVKRVPVLL